MVRQSHHNIQSTDGGDQREPKKEEVYLLVKQIKTIYREAENLSDLSPEERLNSVNLW